MLQAKYDFILGLIRTEKLDPSQKDKFLKLSVEEMKKDGVEFDERLATIEAILNKESTGHTANVQDVTRLSKKVGKMGSYSEISRMSTNSNTKDSPKAESNLPKYINPSGLYKYLYEYNQNQILKSTCHDIDTDDLEIINDYCGTEQYDFKKHYEKILLEFEAHNKLLAPFSIKALISGYITGKDYKNIVVKNGWSSDKIKTYWGCDKLAEWANKYPNLPPNATTEELKKRRTRGYELNHDFTSQITGKRVQNFRELVLHFKSLFHINRANSLRDIINKQNEIKGWKDKINFKISDDDFPSTIELFTDVDKLIQAYNRLINLIIEQNRKGEKAVVKLNFYQQDQNIRLSIHHLNNTYNKTVTDALDRPGKTYTNLIKMQLNGMCNFYLRADFGAKKYAEINLWNGMERRVQYMDPESFIGGVEHILEFCKK